jgi:RNA-directed DNA polymerase
LDLAGTPAYIHGFEKGKSIPKMAQAHVGKDVVISLDIKDFFPSIKQFMVEALFNSMGITGSAGAVLSELCTYKSYVPQGSLTAPKISNLIAAGTFGPEIEKFCTEKGIALTIYADDITMSYDKEFISLEEAKAYTTSIINFVSESVVKAGFRINKEKTKIMRPHNRQWVCGAVVNSHVNMRKTERLQLRAIIHNCRKNGLEAEAAKSKINPEAFIRKYAGRLNWLCQLNPDAGVPLKAAFKKITQPYLKKFPNVEIPELAWSSSIEMTADMNPKDEIESDEPMIVEGDFKMIVQNKEVPPIQTPQ